MGLGKWYALPVNERAWLTSFAAASGLVDIQVPVRPPSHSFICCHAYGIVILDP